MIKCWSDLWIFIKISRCRGRLCMDIFCKCFGTYTTMISERRMRTTLHGYILQMLWDIYNHDQRDEDDEDEEPENEEDPPSDDPDLEHRDSVVINEDVGG